ncbi:MAG: HAMP domain-containing histidine kinase [Peptococcaceae bacterium]|jgi:signal transduction histidine kinase|nr:HAMP domain-containing histidine kinase [Peptococcaceae bacterium]
MSGKHIFLRLFLIIAAFLTIFIGAIILFQTKYFGIYYTAHKENEFKTSVQMAVEKLNNVYVSYDDMLRILMSLYDEYGCFAVIYPIENIRIENMRVSKKITLKDLAQLQLTINKQSDINNLLDSEASTYLSNMDSYDTSRIKKARSDVTGLQYLLTMQEIRINGEMCFLGIASSIQAVDEAMATLNSISWIAYLSTVVISFLIAILIAILVTKPLLAEIERRRSLDIMRRDFIANASHEMKTPISIISGYAESLIDGILTPEERTEYENSIYDESQKMGNLVRDMLEVALLQNEKQLPKIGEFQVDELVTKTLSRLEKQIESKNLVVENKDLLSTSIFADESLIETVLVNLVANAVSHTPEYGKIAITLKEYESKIRFEIENDGLLIPEAAIPHIWEGFYRVDKAHDREEGRFGLGLFMVKTIIEKHRGTVGVENRSNGVVFYFELPNK